MRGAIRADRLLRALVERDQHQLQTRAHEPIGRQRKALIAVAIAPVERRYLSGEAIGEIFEANRVVASGIVGKQEREESNAETNGRVGAGGLRANAPDHRVDADL
jgi:hypothetical protein